MSKKDSPNSFEAFGDIMSFEIETIKDPFVSTTISPATRGSASFVVPNKQPAHLDYDRFKQTSEICPSGAIGIEKRGDEKNHSQVSLDMGKCILCGRCSDAAPDLFELQPKFRPPTKERSSLVEQYSFESTLSDSEKSASHEATRNEVKEEIYRVLGRSLAVREIDAGSCNGCEVEIIALNNPIYDIERFGIQFVSSPRHADVLLVTGPVSRNMEVALKRTYYATPDPKLVVAVGACGCSGGIFGESYASAGGVDKVVPVDVYVPGCPPRPEAILQALLTAVSKIGKSGSTTTRR